MEKFKFKFCEDQLTTKYMQISIYIKELIKNGEILDGEKLPSIRLLSKINSVNNDTVINAYKRLVLDGYAVQKIGSGTFVKRKGRTKRIKDDLKDILKKAHKEIKIKGYIDFTGESAVNSLFPISDFKNIINEVIDRDGINSLIDSDPLGYSGLRETISKVFWNNKVSSEDIIILSGAQQGIDVISKSILNVGDNVIIEKPTYSGALSVFNQRRAKFLEVEVNEDGMDIVSLEKTLKKQKIKMLYLMSYFQNPSGITYSKEKKERLLELAKIYDFYIIEDDYLSELVYSEKIEYSSFKAMDKNNRVIYIKSFSKIYLPGIRLGYMIVPDEIKESVEISKFNSDVLTSSLMQRAMDLYLNYGYWIEYIRDLNLYYKEIYNYTIELLEEKLKNKVDFFEPSGGLNLYFKIKNEVEVDCLLLFEKCKERGLLITPGILFYNNYKSGLKYFRISFSNVSKNDIRRGVEIIKESLNS